MRRLTVLLFCIAVAQPLLAQRDVETADRLTRRDTFIPPPPPPPPPSAVPSELVVQKEVPTTNPYLKVATTDSGGSLSPSGTFGLNHREDQRPWFGEVTYKYRGGTVTHRHVFSGLGHYQFWTGTGALSPTLQADASYSTRPGSNQSYSGDITGEITRGNLSLDGIAGYSWLRPESGAAVHDFAPGLSAYYSLTDANLLGVDYNFTNKVDGEDGFDLAFRHKLPAGYAIDLVVFKHSDVRIRIRKNFAAFKMR